jgi:predicted DCC family thiol-disulfide oxidoreductase YuxK
MEKPGKKPVIIYDDQCRLCRRAVRFLNRAETSSTFEFIPSSGQASNQLLKSHQIPKDTVTRSVILIADGQVYTKSSAVIRTLLQKGGIWRLAGLFNIIPEFVRNLIYDWIANTRKML